MRNVTVFSLYSSMLNQIGSIKSCSYDQFFLKSVRTKPYKSSEIGQWKKTLS